MAIKQKMTGLGIPVRHAFQIGGTVANSLTATGTNQSTALLLSLDDVQIFTTVASGTGCIFSDATVYCQGDQVLIANYGATALSVYPATGGSIQGAAANTPASLLNKSSALFDCIDGLNWTVLPANQSPASGLWNPCVSLYDRKPDAEEVLMDQTMSFASTLPINLTGSKGGINTSLNGAAAATADAVFTLYKNGSSIGTATIPSATTGRNIATFSFSSAVSFAIGDSVQFQAPSSQDATLQGISFSFLGTRP